MTDEDEAFGELEKSLQRKMATGVTDGSAECVAMDDYLHVTEQLALAIWDRMTLERTLEKLTGLKWIPKGNTPKFVADIERNSILEEVAKEFDGMTSLGDTAASFACYVRGMKG